MAFITCPIDIDFFIGTWFDVHCKRDTHEKGTSHITIARMWERSDLGIVVVVRGSKLSMKTVLLSPKSGVSAFIGIPPYEMTCRMLSTQIIRNRLHWADIRTRRPAIRITVTWKDIQARLQWAHVHVRRTLNYWYPILFTNQSKFCEDFTDRRVCVWRSTELFVPIRISNHDRLTGVSHGVDGYWHAGKYIPVCRSKTAHRRLHNTSWRF